MKLTLQEFHSYSVVSDCKVLPCDCPNFQSINHYSFMMENSTYLPKVTSEQ